MKLGAQNGKAVQMHYDWSGADHRRRTYLKLSWVAISAALIVAAAILHLS